MTVLPAVLYTDPPWLVPDGRPDPHLAGIERATLAGVDLRFGPHDGIRYANTGSTLNAAATGVQVLVVYRCQVTPELLDAAGPGLQAVVRQGVGVDNLHAEQLAERGIAAYNIPDYCVAEVAAHTAAFALALERRLIPQHLGLTSGTFDIYAGGVPRRLSDHTLGIVGFGRIGRAVARLLGPFYGRTLVYDPYLGADLAEGYGAKAVPTLLDLLAGSDLVTLHCPLDETTDGMLDQAAFTAIRPGAYLVNAARGRLVDPDALAAALADGQIAGAALDVFSPENPHTDPRWKPVLEHPGVLVTSHRAFLSAQAETSGRRRVAQIVRDVLDGTPVRVGTVQARTMR
ncbi:NAD(P)-dependent oxidoreductase [Plantactinospora sp. WMMB334]|uniref:NAD(P)-dependent oxidoreductase n=1 Tax=Plantactinospora sp. WMMB334 TaxID=3404119 RepID=UPI003B945353